MKTIDYRCTMAILAAAIATLGAVARSPKVADREWPTTARPTYMIKLKGVPNFGKLNAFIWRSGQPSRKGYVRLAHKGLRTVVNLCEETPQDKKLIPPGVKYIFIPIHNETAPSAAQARQFLELASNPRNWPLLVHCDGGEGRVGVMAAVVRHSLDGWDNERIMREVGNFRIKHLGFIAIPMVSSQRAFIKHWEANNQPRRNASGPLSGSSARR